MFMADMYKDYAVLYYHCNGVLGDKFPTHILTHNTEKKDILLLCIVSPCSVNTF